MIAYLDPGSGSIIATFVVGGIASIGVAFKTLRARVGGVFSRNKDTDGAAEAAETTEASEADQVEQEAELAVSGGDKD